MSGHRWTAAAFAAGVAAGYLAGGGCGHAGGAEAPAERQVFTDTVRIEAPRAVSRTLTAEASVRVVPVRRDGTAGSDSVTVPDVSVWFDEGGDSAMVIVPRERAEYCDSNYHAYVSGYDVRLDSIFVYPRREVVTVREGRRRWHIGPCAGIGVSRGGIAPFAGVSVTYSILSW